MKLAEVLGDVVQFDKFPYRLGVVLAFLGEVGGFGLGLEGFKLVSEFDPSPKGHFVIIKVFWHILDFESGFDRDVVELIEDHVKVPFDRFRR